MARPTKYTKELVKKAQAYLDGGWETEDDVIPSHVGLSLVLDIRRETLYAWAKEEDKAEFSNILDKINAKQQRVLIAKGLTGDFNSNITKLVLGKHGYHDKQDSTIANPDGGTLVIERVIVDKTTNTDS
jgi:hypothetical protein